MSHRLFCKICNKKASQADRKSKLWSNKVCFSCQSDSRFKKLLEEKLFSVYPQYGGGYMIESELCQQYKFKTLQEAVNTLVLGVTNGKS